jgi:hypothetical protein
MESKEGHALSFDVAQSVLARAARNIGKTYSVTLSVGMTGDTLMFVNDLGEPVIDNFGPGRATEVLCCSRQEVEDGTFLKLFAARSLYAALTMKLAEILESEQAQ